MDATNQESLAALMPSPLDQIRMFQMLNYGCRWGFEDQQISSLLFQASKWDKDPTLCQKPTEVMLLNIGLWSFDETFYRLMEFIWESGYLRISVPYDDLKSVIQRQRSQFSKCTLAWRTVDFGCTSTPSESAYLPDIEVLWAFVCKAKFMETLIHHFGIHRLWLGGTTVNGFTPHFQFDATLGTVELRSGIIQYDTEGDSIPRFA